MDKYVKQLYRGTVSVHEVVISPNRTHVAVLSEGNSIKYVNMEDIAKISLFSGHSKPVKSVCFSPAGDYLVSAGTDGLLKVWKIDGDDGECIKTIEREIDFLDLEDKEPFGMAWNPNGKYFVVPGKRGDILLIRKESWKVLGNLKGGHVKVYQ
jgi:WD40 repeat protein